LPLFAGSSVVGADNPPGDTAPPEDVSTLLGAAGSKFEEGDGDGDEDDDEPPQAATANITMVGMVSIASFLILKLIQ
jgi:hypothetical protein